MGGFQLLLVHFETLPLSEPIEPLSEPIEEQFAGSSNSSEGRDNGLGEVLNPNSHLEDRHLSSSVVKKSGIALAAWQRFFSHGSPPSSLSASNGHLTSKSLGTDKKAAQRDPHSLKTDHDSPSQEQYGNKKKGLTNVNQSKPIAFRTSKSAPGTRRSAEEQQTSSSNRASSEIQSTPSEAPSFPTELSRVGLHLA